MLSNCKNNLACTAMPADEDAIDAIVASVGVNDGGDGLGDAEDSQDTPRKMEDLVLL